MVLGIRLLVSWGSGSAAMLLDEVPILLVALAGAPVRRRSWGIAVSRKSYRMHRDDFPCAEKRLSARIHFLRFFVFVTVYSSAV